MISVIIPTYNDESNIANTISNLQQNAYKGLLKQIIVVDGGSSDKTVREAEEAGATVFRSIRRGHAIQMNLGAQYATGKILYFLFPGSIPPKHFTNEIVRATQNGFSVGTFEVKFNYQHWLLKGLNIFSKMKLAYSRLEDQSLFVVQELFVKAGKFREDLQILADHEMLSRLKRYSRFIVLKDKILSSTKKYVTHSLLRREASYLIASLMYWKGYPQKKLMKLYHALLSNKPEQARTGDALSPSFH